MNVEYVVKCSAAPMPSSCWGTYRRVAVLEIDADVVAEHGFPRMISTHARGVLRVVETWERLNVGTTERCAYERALVEAENLAWTLTQLRDRNLARRLARRKRRDA